MKPRSRHDGLQTIMDEAFGGMATNAGGELNPQGCKLAKFWQRVRTTKALGSS